MSLVKFSKTIPIPHFEFKINEIEQVDECFCLKKEEITCEHYV
jgi:hypothetical protein